MGATRRALPLLPSLLILIILRLPSFFEGLWFDDEGVYAAVAKGLHDGKILYLQTWDSKPPAIFLLYWLAGFLSWTRAMPLLHLLALCAGIASLVLLSRVALRLALGTGAACLATCFFAVFIGSCVFDGASTEIEIWFLPVTLATLYLLVRRGPSFRTDALAGALVVLACLIKPQAGFEAAAIVAVVALGRGGERAGTKRGTAARALLAAGAGAAAALSVAGAILLATRTLGAFWYATFSFNLGYTATASRAQWLGSTLDLRSLRLLLAAGVAALALALWKTGRLSFRGFLIVSLIDVELACATLSGRAYNHYALQLAPGLSLLVGWVAEAVRERGRAVRLAAGSAALLAAFWLLPSAVLGLNWQASVYPRPNDYYVTFAREFVLSREHRWRWRDAGGITRVTAFAARYNAAYAGGPRQTYFLFSSKPWLYALLRPRYTNRYMEWSDWYDVPGAEREELGDAAAASIVILDTYEPNESKARYRAILTELRRQGHLVKVEQDGSFEIYANRRP